MRMTGDATEHEGCPTVKKRSALEKLGLAVQGLTYILSFGHDKTARSQIDQRRSAFARAWCALQPLSILCWLSLFLPFAVASFSTTLEQTPQRARSELRNERLGTMGTSIQSSAHVGEQSVA